MASKHYKTAFEADAEIHIQALGLGNPIEEREKDRIV